MVEVFTWFGALYSKLKVFYNKIFKNGSISLALLIPLIMLLDSFDLIPENILYIISSAIVIFAFIEVIFQIVLKEYQKAVLQIAETKKAISEGNIDAIKENINESTSIDELKNSAVILLNSLSDLLKRDKSTNEIMEDVQETIKKIENNQNTEFLR